MRLSRWVGTGAAMAIIGGAVAFAVPTFAASTATPEPTSSAVMPSDATKTPSDTDSSETCLPRRIRHLATHRQTDELRAAIEKALEQEPGEARRDALRGIFDDVIAGKYGEKAHRIAESRGHDWHRMWRQLPQELRNDLKALRDDAPGEARRDAAKDIFDKTLSGEYGDDAQRFADRLHQCFCD